MAAAAGAANATTSTPAASEAERSALKRIELPDRMTLKPRICLSVPRPFGSKQALNSPQRID
jgi:hypothetical protein